MKQTRFQKLVDSALADHQRTIDRLHSCKPAIDIAAEYEELFKSSPAGDLPSSRYAATTCWFDNTASLDLYLGREDKPALVLKPILDAIKDDPRLNLIEEIDYRRESGKVTLRFKLVETPLHIQVNGYIGGSKTCKRVQAGEVKSTTYVYVCDED